MGDRFSAKAARTQIRAGRTFLDWTGSIGLAEDITRGPRLEADAGLDRSRWFVVAINVELACSADATDRISVDAVDLSAFDIDAGSGGYQDLVTLANTHGSLPVTRIELPATTARDLLSLMTTAVIQVQLAGLDADINVVAQRRHDTTASAE
ncbi:hypothetical protein [Mycobacteroides abscessus]|uniref:hypothetical protein n=1 Tax=Mycobacteroides abscessus TaxID=36809 RepID=UPI00030CE078|nr:hypothetical protein [Mycobacteroides abscessus]MDO2968220.1 hypothetical protein [Mycobacteroides abscessus subsp. bolletii]MDO3080444.1 hypothetical protein [Mycobacteroides abscessus subsp. bolletii]